MNLSDVKKMIVPLYNTRTPATLIGSPGIGKSDLVRELPGVLSAALGVEFGLVTVEASTLDSPDVIGFLIPTKNADGEAVARYTKPDIMRRIEATGLSHGILFIDEIGQADALVQKAFAPLYIGGTLGEYSIPKGWYVMSATNRVQDRAGVVKELSHFTNRQCRLNIEANIDDYLVWARGHKVHHMGMAYANFRQGVVITSEVPAKPGAYCTPRSFTASMRFVSELLGDDDEAEIPCDDVTQSVIAGYVGEATSADMFAFFKVHELLPTYAEIVADPDNAKVPPDDRLDAAYAAAGLVTAKATVDDVDEAFRFCTRLPVELQTSVARTLIQSIGGLALNSPSINSFVAKHKSLILSSIS